ncbi:MAG: DUF5615 family PIN-like protein [Deltaproteobacteria bacterium]|nr:DUF5615 family PIN-like protein [Deltaproteobacteria bacterium]
MRVKLDENLPAELADDLRQLGHEVDSVASEGLTGRPDSTVARAARKARRVLFTLDKGLGDIRRFPPRLYDGIVIFRLSSNGRTNTRHAVLSALSILGSQRQFAGRLFVVTENGLRVRR